MGLQKFVFSEYQYLHKRKSVNVKQSSAIIKYSISTLSESYLSNRIYTRSYILFNYSIYQLASNVTPHILSVTQHIKQSQTMSAIDTGCSISTLFSSPRFSGMEITDLLWGSTNLQAVPTRAVIHCIHSICQQLSRVGKQEQMRKEKVEHEVTDRVRKNKRGTDREKKRKF